MKIHLLIAVLLALFAISCDKMDVSPEQSDEFIKYYTNFPDFTAADVVQVNQSGYAILGTAKEEFGNSQICLLRTDEFGNSLDSARIYGRSLDNQAYCLEVLDDGGFAILGSSRNPVTEKLEVYFIRTNSVGDTLWTRTIAESGNVEAKHFEMNSQESFFMTGYVDTDTKAKEIWWYAIDKNGIGLWNTKTYGLSRNDEGTHLQLLETGELRITGYVTEGSLIKPLIIMTNNNGTVEFPYVIPATTNEAGNCLSVIDDKNILLLSTLSGSGISDVSLKHTYLSPTEQDIQWTNTYRTTANIAGKSVIATNNAFFILNTTSTAGSNTAISIISTDLLGNQTEHWNFGLGSELSASAFKQTSDGGFIIVGTNRHAENDVSITLIKTGASGTL